MDKDLDPLRELDTEAIEDAVRAPTTSLAQQSSRHDPTARIFRDTSFDENPYAVPLGSPNPAAAVTNRQGYTASTPSPARGGLAPRNPQMLPACRDYVASPKIKIRENIQRQPRISILSGLVPILAIFVLGLAMSFAAIVVVQNRNSTTAPTTQTSSAQPGTQAAISPPKIDYGVAENSFIEPIFGQYAVRNCLSRCAKRGPGALDTCNRSCNIYQIQNFGRRITFERFEPVNDGNQMVSRCMTREVNLEAETSGSRWYQQTNATLSTLQKAETVFRSNDFTQLRGMYHGLLDANKAIRLPPGGTSAEIAFSKELARATCLAANLALTKIAIGVVESNQDSFSTRSYRQMAQTVEAKSNEVLAAITVQAKSLKLIDAPVSINGAADERI